MKVKTRVLIERESCVLVLMVPLAAGSAGGFPAWKPALPSVCLRLSCPCGTVLPRTQVPGLFSALSLCPSRAYLIPL